MDPASCPSNVQSKHYPYLLYFFGGEGLRLSFNTILRSSVSGGIVDVCNALLGVFFFKEVFTWIFATSYLSLAKEHMFMKKEHFKDLMLRCRISSM